MTLFKESDDARTEAVSRSAAEAAEQREQAELEQARLDSEAMAQLDAMLADHGFMSLLADAIDEAVRTQELGQVRDFGYDVDVYGAHVDVVEEVNGSKISSVHVTAEGLALTEVSATVVASAITYLHPSEAAILEGTPGAVILDHGYDRGQAEAQVEVAFDGVFDVVIDPANGTLESLATVSELKPRNASRAERS